MEFKYYQNLKKLRIRKRLSIRQLSQMTGISEAILQNIEDQITLTHSIDKIAKLAEVLEVNIDDFIKKEL